MTSYDISTQQDTDVIWQHLDYYVRRVDDELVLVQTLLKLLPGEPVENGEITTYYIELSDLDEDWAQAVLEQGYDLEEGKSCDFVPPDEVIMYGDDLEEDI